VNRKAQLICAWCGPLCALLFALGAVFLGRFIPPLVAPGDSAHEVARKFAEHTDQIRIGALVTIISMSLVGPWGVSIAAQIRRTEGGFPILTYVQIICVAVGTTVVVLMSMFWACAAFRPGVYSDETVMVLNDIAYFLFLFTWAPFSIWALAVALAIFLDPNERPVYPRYVAYTSLWVAVLFVPAGLMAFFKTGPFAWNGLMALYIPVGIFFVWLAVLTTETLKNINRGHAHDPGGRAAPAVVTRAPEPTLLEV
jgi:hypothetical protein